jgi:hypothetical protein
MTDMRAATLIYVKDGLSLPAIELDTKYGILRLDIQGELWIVCGLLEHDCRKIRTNNQISEEAPAHLELSPTCLSE